jgi:hypothetical protein
MAKARKKSTAAPLARPTQITVDDKKVAIVRTMKTKHGLRKSWGRNEFVQFGIQMVCEGYPPRDINITQLTKDVSKFLDDYPPYQLARLGKITRRMVQRVLDLMRMLGRMRP